MRKCDLAIKEKGGDIANKKSENQKKGESLGKIMAALTIDKLYDSAFGVDDSIEAIKYSCSRVNEGDLSDVDSLLMSQAQTMNVLFQRCTSLILEQSNAVAMQAISDIALKAQKQSAKTLQILADLKHPKRTTFIQQQNNAVNQQVNNSEK